MAEYLIQDTTLDAIANAINAKTGGSSAMTPAEMVTEIAGIPSGGGGGWELIAEATTDEDVEAFRVDIPAAKQNMAAYLVEYDCVFVGSKYPCPRLNSINNGSPYLSSTSHYIGSHGIAYSGTGYKMLVRDESSPPPKNSAVASVEYVAMVGYYAGDLVAAGSTIKVYGIGEPT